MHLLLLCHYCQSFCISFRWYQSLCRSYFSINFQPFNRAEIRISSIYINLVNSLLVITQSLSILKRSGSKFGRKGAAFNLFMTSPLSSPTHLYLKSLEMVLQTYGLQKLHNFWEFLYTKESLSTPTY